MSTGTLQDCQRACQQVFCVQEKFYLAARGFITLQFGEGGVRVFWLCGVTSLLMYSIDAPQRIVTKSLYRTALPNTQCWNLPRIAGESAWVGPRTPFSLTDGWEWYNNAQVRMAAGHWVVRCSLFLVQQKIISENKVFFVRLKHCWPSRKGLFYASYVSYQICLNATLSYILRYFWPKAWFSILITEPKVKDAVIRLHSISRFPRLEH